MLTETKIRQILDHLPRLTIAVVGDFFLDKYLDIDGQLTEKSLETGLDAYQVTGVRTSPGAGGTVANNLSALGVGHISALTVIGLDGEGFELKRELANRRVDLKHVVEAPDRRTPTYTKPMLGCSGDTARELNRLDIQNRQPMPTWLAGEIADRLEQVAAEADAVIIADQVSEPECGVLTYSVRERLSELGQRHLSKILFADSRARIGLYRNVITKPNRIECLRAVGESDLESVDWATIESAAQQLSGRTGRPVYCTLGTDGCLYSDGGHATYIPAYSVNGPIDIVGAGDSATAGIVTALCGSATPVEAAAVGNLCAAVTIRKLGRTGIASIDEVRALMGQCAVAAVVIP